MHKVTLSCLALLVSLSGSAASGRRDSLVEESPLQIGSGPTCVVADTPPTALLELAQEVSYSSASARLVREGELITVWVRKICLGLLHGSPASDSFAKKDRSF